MYRKTCKKNDSPTLCVTLTVRSLLCSQLLTKLETSVSTPRFASKKNVCCSLASSFKDALKRQGICDLAIRFPFKKTQSLHNVYVAFEFAVFNHVPMWTHWRGSDV